MESRESVERRRGFESRRSFESIREGVESIRVGVESSGRRLEGGVAIDKRQRVEGGGHLVAIGAREHRQRRLQENLVQHLQGRNKNYVSFLLFFFLFCYSLFFFLIPLPSFASPSFILFFFLLLSLPSTVSSFLVSYSPNLFLIHSFPLSVSASLTPLFPSSLYSSFTLFLPPITSSSFVSLCHFISQS